MSQYSKRYLSIALIGCLMISMVFSASASSINEPRPVDTKISTALM